MPPGNVLMLAEEDNADTTTSPRLEAAGANLDRVFFWPEELDPVKLPSGVDTLAAVVKRYDISLTIFDPIGAYFDASINTNVDADVRRALRPLVSLTQETNMAALCSRHLNKDENKSALYRGGGSIAFTAAARVVWAVGADPKDSSRLVLAVLKSNIGIKPPSLSYSIEGVGNTSRIKWEGQSSCTARDIFARKQYRSSKADDAEHLIADLLAHGPRPEPEVHDACRNAGIGEWSYRKARKNLDVQSSKDGMRDGWLLSLPEGDGEHEGDGEQC
jgi:putative DNA primase/helicase